MDVGLQSVGFGCCGTQLIPEYFMTIARSSVTEQEVGELRPIVVRFRLELAAQAWEKSGIKSTLQLCPG